MTATGLRALAFACILASGTALLAIHFDFVPDRSKVRLAAACVLASCGAILVSAGVFGPSAWKGHRGPALRWFAAYAATLVLFVVSLFTLVEAALVGG